MSFTVINRFAMAHLHSHLAVVYHHDSPLLATSPHQLSHQTRRSEAEPQTSGSSRWGRPVTCDFSAGHAVGYRLSSVVRPVSLGGGRAAGRAGRDARAGRAAVPAASHGRERPTRVRLFWSEPGQAARVILVVGQVGAVVFAGQVPGPVGVEVVVADQGA